MPEDKIRSRYERNQALIKAAMSKSDNGVVYDNSTLNNAPKWAILVEQGRAMRISETVPDWARELY